MPRPRKPYFREGQRVQGLPPRHGADWLPAECRRLVAKHPTGPLFRNSRGKPWNRNAIRCRFRRLRKKLNLDKGVVAYAYRHTYTTAGLEGGVPIATMAELLGHTSTDMINEHYGHLDQRTAHLREAARRAAGPREGA